MPRYAKLPFPQLLLSIFLTPLFLVSLFLVPLCFLATVTPAQAADWSACEKAKLRQLNLEQTARADHKGRGKKAGAKSSRSKHNAEQLDEWLWKNCRDYSYELRNLEQQRM